MVGEIVRHVRFGRGVVTGFEPPRMDVRFDADQVSRRFSYPGVAEKFLSFEGAEAAERARRDLEAQSVLSQQAIMERIAQNRRREEQLNAARMDALRKKRTDAAKKAAERRKQAMAAKADAQQKQA